MAQTLMPTLRCDSTFTLIARPPLRTSRHDSIRAQVSVPCDCPKWSENHALTAAS